MNLTTALAMSIVLASAAGSKACDLTFKLHEGGGAPYGVRQIPEFVKDKIRPSLSKDTSYFHIVGINQCQDSADSVSLTLQKSNYYVLFLNDSIPLQVKGKNGYDYVAYKGGAYIGIDSARIVESFRTLSKVPSQAYLFHASKDSAQEKVIHDAVRTFAFVFAEASRFDYVLNGLACGLHKDSANQEHPVQFMDYWILLHNWSTINTVITDSAPQLMAHPTYHGSRKLFAPVTWPMVSYFDDYLVRHPTTDTTKDGKNKHIPIMDSCKTRP